MTPEACALSPALLARARELAWWRDTLYFGGEGWSILSLLVLARAGAGSWLAALGRRVSSRPAVQGWVVAPVALAVLALVALPVAVLGHGVSLRFGLSVEPWGAWWEDWALSEALLLAVGTPLLCGLYSLLRTRGNTAWLWAWAASLPLLLVGTWLMPLVVDPLFNHFSPLGARDPALVARLEQVAARGALRVPPERILVMDASRRSTGVNAYVTGLGSSKRIVVWDTALAQLPPEEILVVYAHEQGHYVLHHIAKGLLFAAGFLLPMFFLAWVLVRRNVREPSSWASLPTLLLVSSLLSFLAEPAVNGFSRVEEHAADVYGLQTATGIVPNAPAVEVADFCRLGRVWLDDPAPNPFVVWWSYTHPPTSERAAWAARQAPRGHL